MLDLSERWHRTRFYLSQQEEDQRPKPPETNWRKYMAFVTLCVVLQGVWKVPTLLILREYFKNLSGHTAVQMIGTLLCGSLCPSTKPGHFPVFSFKNSDSYHSYAKKEDKSCSISDFHGSLFAGRFSLCMVLQHTPFTSHVTPVTFSMSFLASLQPWPQDSPLGHQSTLHWEQCWYRKLRGRACDQTCGKHRHSRYPSLGLFQKLLLGEGASAPCHPTGWGKEMSCPGCWCA